jgi:hypothetical protein
MVVVVNGCRRDVATGIVVVVDGVGVTVGVNGVLVEPGGRVAEQDD